MQGITEEKLQDRFGPEIGPALFEQLSKELSNLDNVMLIDAALDMRASQVAQQMGRELNINYGDGGPPPISGDQMAKIMDFFSGGRDQGIER